MAVNLKSLIGRLNSICYAALETAAGACVTRGAGEVTVEDLLLQLLEGVETDLALLLKASDVDAGEFRSALQRELEGGAGAADSKPVFSNTLLQLLEQAWLYASVELGETRIRSAALVAGMRRNGHWYTFRGYASLLERLPADVAEPRYQPLLNRSAEASEHDPAASDTSAAASDSMLARFTHDFSARAAAGELDPVFCRDREIRQLIDVLSRRQKNNPILVGEPGVGKSAVVEGLARQIAAGEVPPSLRDARVLALDIGLLQAGASVRGEFEKRLSGLLRELREQSAPVVLFIDEAHMLIGAGGSGGGDAANLLKPALARGELRTIAATTWAEYRQYFEKDAALARRFQPIRLDEPTPEQALTILRGLRDTYERAHGVYVRDDALQAAATLSARYITGRQLPDKAVDVLDTACARVNLALHAPPAALESLRRREQQLEREQAALTRDGDHGVAADADRVAALMDELRALRGAGDRLEQRWREELAHVQALVETRAGDSPERRQELERIRLAHANAADGEPLIAHEVSPEVIAQVVSDWTGVPLGRLVEDEAAVLLDLSQRLGARVRGQDEALEMIAQRIRTAKSGLGNPDAPLGVFLLVGPSGVGKSESAAAVAELLFGGTQALVTINLSEFQEKHSISRLIGSPPGYVGYGEGGVLTEAVRQRPYSVVLLDEVEKADIEVLNVFYQMLDKGVLSDGEGREIDFRNTVVFLTSNLGSDLVASACAERPAVTAAELVDLLRPTLTRFFRPALLARMEIVPYRSIGHDVLTDIVSMKLDRVAQRLRARQGLELEVGEGLTEHIVRRCTVAEAGARNVEAIINREVLPEMARDLLGRLSDDSAPKTCRVAVRDDRVTVSLES